jgi:serine/threonine-protein phosphatase 2A catalytic subunit
MRLIYTKWFCYRPQSICVCKSTCKPFHTGCHCDVLHLVIPSPIISHISLDKKKPKTGQKKSCRNESNVQPITAPLLFAVIFIVLVELFSIGRCPETNYLSWETMSIEGYYSLETVTLLVALVQYRAHYNSSRKPRVVRITWFTVSMMNVFKVWKRENVQEVLYDTFDYCPTDCERWCRTVYSCLHGGLSPSIDTLDHARDLDRVQEVPHEDNVILFGRPDDRYVAKRRIYFASCLLCICMLLCCRAPYSFLTLLLLLLIIAICRCGWYLTTRGAGYTFGQDVTEQFTQ